MSSQRKQQYGSGGLKPGLAQQKAGGPSANQGPRHGSGLVSLGAAKVIALWLLACTCAGLPFLQRECVAGCPLAWISATPTVALMVGAPPAEERRHCRSKGLCAQASEPPVAEEGGCLSRATVRCWRALTIHVRPSPWA